MTSSNGIEAKEGTPKWYEEKAMFLAARARVERLSEPDNEIDDARQEALEREAEEEGQEIGYASRLLIQATLPHSKPTKDTLEFVRSNGHVTVKLTADSSYGLPYGIYPRLLMAYITTEAVRTKSPTVKFGRSLRDLARKLHIEYGSGPRGSGPRIRDQVKRLFSSHVSATCQRQGEWHRLNFHPLEKASMFWGESPRSNGKDKWQSVVTLNETFFEEITNKPVPVDMQALYVLGKHGSLAFDIYQWLTHRLSYLRSATTVPWDALQLQFGGSFARRRDFRARFLQHMKVVVDMYPEANVEATLKGLLLKPSKTHIPKKIPRRE